MRWSGSRRLVGAVLVGVLASVSLSGCDYWPPALQAQIEQLRAELDAATTERTKLEGQLAELAKARDELQAQVSELTRQNQELLNRVTVLDQSLAAEREKLAKLMKGSAKAKAKASTTDRSSSKGKMQSKSGAKKKTTAPEPRR